MEWYTGTVALLSGIGTVVSVLSRWAAYSSKHLRSRVIDIFEEYARSSRGKFFFRAYLKELEKDDDAG
jgi:hypothetical protein